MSRFGERLPKDKQDPIFIYVSLMLIVLTICSIGYFYFSGWDKKIISSDIFKQKVETPEFAYASKLTGEGVIYQEEITPQVIVVMMDNNIEARPQSGLADARVVYEVPVEGNITRYMALFESIQTADKVGPVRSARPYFLDWLKEYGDPMYMHSGGSLEALKLLKNGNYFDVNEFYWGSYFWRDHEKYAPHNLYTNSENWQKILDEEEIELTDWEGWLFDDWQEQNIDQKEVEIKALKIAYSNYYEVSWSYNTFSSQYEYSINNEKYSDTQGNPIMADTVIVQYVNTKILDSEGRLEIVTAGEGQVKILKQGQLIRGRWRKTSTEDRTKFYDDEGKEISLKSGVIWVEVVPNNINVKIVS